MLYEESSTGNLCKKIGPRSALSVRSDLKKFKKKIADNKNHENFSSKHCKIENIETEYYQPLIMISSIFFIF